MSNNLNNMTDNEYSKIQDNMTIDEMVRLVEQGINNLPEKAPEYEMTLIAWDKLFFLLQEKNIWKMEARTTTIDKDGFAHTKYGMP
jgi:hypothetical protein